MAWFITQRTFVVAVTIGEDIVQRQVTAVNRTHALAEARKLEPTASSYEILKFQPVPPPGEAWR